MKCNDIARILDERAPSALSSAESAALEAHLLHCDDCTAQWRASEQLQSFRSEVPPMPASLRERARQIDGDSESTRRERASRRPLIIGSLLLLGAAATMFTAIPLRDSRAANQS